MSKSTQSRPDSDVSVLLRAAHLLRERQRSPSKALSVRDLRVPDISDWDHDPFAKLVYSLLDKAPLSIHELAHRTDIDKRDLPKILFARREDFGKAITLYAITRTEPTPLSEGFSAEGVPAGAFTEIGVDPDHRSSLLEYVVRSLAREIRSAEDRRACAAPT